MFKVMKVTEFAREGYNYGVKKRVLKKSQARECSSPELAFASGAERYRVLQYCTFTSGARSGCKTTFRVAHCGISTLL